MSTASKAKELATKSRKTKADYRAEIPEAPPPPKPFLQSAVDSALSSGVHGIRQQQRLAWTAVRKYEREITAEWTRPPSKWLQHRVSELSGGIRPRAYLRWCVSWRARFLACLSISHCPTLSARHARVARSKAFSHRALDPEFAADWEDACQHATDLLQARAMQRALEGDLEPVHYMGVVVDYVRKFDGRLQIEMLRALRPDRFKTAGVNLNLATKGDIFVLTEEQRHELQAINRQWLERQRDALPEDTSAPALSAPAPAAT